MVEKFGQPHIDREQIEKEQEEKYWKKAFEEGRQAIDRVLSKIAPLKDQLEDETMSPDELFGVTGGVHFGADISTAIQCLGREDFPIDEVRARNFLAAVASTGDPQLSWHALMDAPEHLVSEHTREKFVQNVERDPTVEYALLTAINARGLSDKQRHRLVTAIEESGVTLQIETLKDARRNIQYQDKLK